MRRGDVRWGFDDNSGKYRPWVILTRNAAMPVLNRVLVAPVTTTIRSIPSEVRIGPDDGLPRQGAINLDNVQLYNPHLLAELICTLDASRMMLVCRALRHAVDC